MEYLENQSHPLKVLKILEQYPQHYRLQKPGFDKVEFYLFEYLHH